MNQSPIQKHFEALLEQAHGEHRTILEIQEQPQGAQGYSGSQVCYFAVASRDSHGNVHSDTLVTKSASLLERRILHLLSSQGCAVPPLVIPDLTREERAQIYMPFLDDRPTFFTGYSHPLTTSMADGLAGIHAANLQKPPDWLPRVSDRYLDQLWLRAWHEKWESNLKDPEFAAEFGAYTPQLESAMERFMKTLEFLTTEGTTLTLLNVDLIPDHIRLWQGQIRFIDWEQCAYGSLYLDLVNPFTVENVLAYRDALARHGHSIPVPEFLERFHEIGRYMGLRYLGYSLWQWEQGGEERNRGRWFLYYTFGLALHGR